ncbi:3'-5' exoribonuclease [Nocardia sp. NPDC051756]|uniref:3'-5' exoribonuclease domain-containing protein n=1 Tax=Nocardia sp. NPDC051756 TaxID=3154751 RepID=UPI0034282C72
MTVPLVFLDTETDGVHPDRKAWEVAMVRRDEHGQRETQFFVDIDLTTADPFGLKIGRFYDRHPLGRQVSAASGNDSAAGEAWEEADWRARVLPKNQAAMRIARWTHGAQIVGAVPNFDTETLAAMLRRHGLCPSWHHRLRCVESLSAGHFGREVGGLSDCAAAFEIEHPAAHTAMGDALTAMAIWDRVMTPRGEATESDLERESAEAMVSE